jgi:hypothetical protein
MIRRLRVLLPPAGYLLAFLVLYAVAYLPLITWGGRFGGNRPPDSLYRPQQIVLGFATVAYAAYRVLAFHPFYRPGYRNWLMTTPWAWGKPLPAGPIPLVWEDAVIVAAACLPAWVQGTVHPLGTISLLLGVYLFALAQTFWTTGAWAAGYAVLFGVGLGMRLCREAPAVHASAMMMAYAVGMLGLRRSLRRWPDWSYWQDSMSPQAQSGGTSSAQLGWPYDRLGPKFTQGGGGVRAIDGILGGLLAGWALHAVGAVFDNLEVYVALVQATVFQFILIGPGARVSAYVTGYAPPISLGGRFRTFRWIIPSYDQVFVTPLVAMFAGLLAFAGAKSLGWPPDVVVPVTATLSLWALLLGGPPRRRWWLTARHRIVPAVKASGGYVQVG